MKSPPLLATLLMLLGVGILCALGTWQLHRLEWKQGILASMKAEYARNAADIKLSPADLEKDFEYTRGTLKGVYDYGKNIYVGPRTHDGTPGSYQLTPFELEDGSFILVNRGWVPQSWKPADESADVARQVVNATGLLRKPDQTNPFTPQNNPAKNQWYSINPTQMAAAYNIPSLRPYILYLEVKSTWGDYPVPFPSQEPEIPDNHLQYAIFWFAMAGILLAVFYLRFMRNNNV